MELFDERAVLVHDGLMYRYNRLAGTLAKNAPILYQYGATGHRLSGDEVVQPIFDNGEATASIGYIGLHEVATRFWGNDWQDNEEAKTFTVGVLERLNYWKSKWADETGIAFSV
ncbi:MAG: anaerobic ribonucleoside-triphosphate reductase, partial [Streptococcus sp.]